MHVAYIYMYIYMYIYTHRFRLIIFDNVILKIILLLFIARTNDAISVGYGPIALDHEIYMWAIIYIYIYADTG